MWTPYEYVLAIVMVVAGSVNIIISKWTDITLSEGRDGKLKEFTHPFLQALGMFFAELTWLFAYKYIICYYQSRNVPQHLYPTAVRGGTNFNPLIFSIPAALDMIGTSLMFIALTMTSASSFQMFRGSLIIFTGLLSVAFLGRKISWYQWLGIVVITIGLVFVGVGDIRSTHNEADLKMTAKAITGDLIIIISQIVIAAQYVFEERFIQNVSPFQAIGWEGFFGFVMLSVLLVPMYFIKVPNIIFNNPGYHGSRRLEDSIDAFYQLTNSWKILAGFCGGLISLAFFNISGISVTKQLSATTRTVLDSIRTFIVWLFSILVNWQAFHYLHVVGFVVLVIGMLIEAGLLNSNTEENVDESQSTQNPYGSVNDSSSVSFSSGDTGAQSRRTRLKAVS